MNSIMNKSELTNKVCQLIAFFIVVYSQYVMNHFFPTLPTVISILITARHLMCAHKNLSKANYNSIPKLISYMTITFLVFYLFGFGMPVETRFIKSFIAAKRFDKCYFLFAEFLHYCSIVSYVF